MANIIVFLEQRNGQIKKSSFEAASKAVELAQKTNATVTAVTCGADISNLEAVGQYGITSVVHLQSDSFAQYSKSGYKSALLTFLAEKSPSLVLLANTAMGKDLAPALAVKLQAGLLMDAIELQFDGSKTNSVKPIYAGKAKISVQSSTGTTVATLRPNVFKLLPQTVTTEITVKAIENPDLRNKVVSFIKAGEKLDVAEADIIVSGGRGMKGPEHFALIESVAAELNAAVGASRAVVDAGWRPHSEQVGQTGKTVSPNLYIACGISGAIQHLAGMSSSRYIVAINKDKDAPIFSVADYGITGDVFEILPVLQSEIKKLKS